MRAREFISEAVVKHPHDSEARPERETGKSQPRMNPDHEAVMQGVHKSRDVGGYDRVYHMNRLWMAMACADGKSRKAVDMDASSWSEKYNTIHPYTEEEENMVHQAFATVPSDHEHHVASKKSVEPEYVYKVSPVSSFKGYDK